jgi:hypothetical protein
MVETYGGRGAEGADGAVFSVPVSEVIYWQNFREHAFWDNYMDSFEIECDMIRTRPERRERTRQMIEEYFEENDRL